MSSCEFMSAQPIHALRIAEVFPALATSPDGLAPEEIANHQALYGQNVLAEPAQASLWQKWAVLATHPMALLLLVAGFIAMIDGRLTLGLIIWVVVLVNAGFSFWQ